MAEQVSNPFCIFDIGFVTWDLFHVLGIHDDQDAVVILEHSEDGPPVDASRFHGDVCHLQLVEPIGECQQVSRHGTEGSNQPLHGAILSRQQHTCDNGLLMHVQPTRPCMNDLHRTPPSRAVAAGVEDHTNFSSVLAPMERRHGSLLDTPASAFRRAHSAVWRST